MFVFWLKSKDQWLASFRRSLSEGGIYQWFIAQPFWNDISLKVIHAGPCQTTMSEATLWDGLAMLAQMSMPQSCMSWAWASLSVCPFSYSFRADLRENYILLLLAQIFMFSIKFVRNEGRCAGRAHRTINAKLDCKFVLLNYNGDNVQFRWVEPCQNNVIYCVGFA